MARANKSMDVRAKQRLSYHAALFPLACVYSVSPHVISTVMPFRVNMNEQIKKLIFSFRRLSLPVKLVVIHTLIISVAMALYPTDIFIPDAPYDDVYIIYMLVPGFHIYMIVVQLSHQLFPWLLTKMSHYTASVLCIVFIPGVVGIIIGGLQWYIIGKMIVLFRGERQTQLR